MTVAQIRYMRHLFVDCSIQISTAIDMYSRLNRQCRFVTKIENKMNILNNFNPPYNKYHRPINNDE